MISGNHDRQIYSDSGKITNFNIEIIQHHLSQTQSMQNYVALSTENTCATVKGRYRLLVNTARTYGPYLRPVYTGAFFLTPVHMACVYRCRKMHPYIRAVYTGDRYALPIHTAHIYGPRTYGPYLQIVCIGLKLPANKI